jgi:hypothetical protein
VGHAVVALSRGRSVTSVVVYQNPRPDETGRIVHGECIYVNRFSWLAPGDLREISDRLKPEDRTYLEDNLLILLGGPIAEEMAANGTVKLTTDRVDAKHIAAALEGGAAASAAIQQRLAEAEQTVQSLVKEHRVAVRAIAAELLHVGTIDGTHAREILDVHSSS